MRFDRQSIAARVAFSFLITGCVTIGSLALSARFFAGQFSQLSVAGILEGAADDIAESLTSTDQGLVVNLSSIETWGYDALYGNIGYRVIDAASQNVLLSSDDGRLGAIVTRLPSALQPNEAATLDDGVVAFRLPGRVGARAIFIDVARSDRLGELAGEAVVPAITEAVFASILLAILVFTGALFLTSRRVSVSIRDMANALVVSANNQQKPDVEPADVPVELMPLAEAFRSAVGDMLEAYEAQRRFTENAAHELKTPLTVARISIEKLQDIDETEREELLQRIDVTAEMVQRLLELSRAQQKSAYKAQKVCVLAVLETVRDMVTPLAEKQGVALRIESKVNNWCFIGDRTAWIVAIKNLVDNALRHAAGVSVITMLLIDDQLRIENDGSSIASEHRAHIFERFFRGGASTISSGGLGLSIVHEIFIASGASISHRDRQPSGSIFVVDLKEVPRIRPSASASASASA